MVLRSLILKIPYQGPHGILGRAPLKGLRLMYGRFGVQPYESYVVVSTNWGHYFEGSSYEGSHYFGSMLGAPGSWIRRVPK